MAEKKTEKWKSARTKNLSESQMKRAQRVVGRGRMEKVTAAERKAATDFVPIGTTKWLEAKDRGGKGRGGLLVDASGKAVTGTVKLPSGQSATYVRGKRIGVARGTAGGRKTGGRTTDKTGNPPPKTGARYEERKARVGAMTQKRSSAASLRSNQGKFGGGGVPSPSGSTRTGATATTRPLITGPSSRGTRENQLINLIRREQERLRMARQRKASAAEAAKYQEKLKALESQLRALKAQG